MLMTVGSLMELVNRIQNTEVCLTCNKPRTRLILERKSGQYKLNFACRTCFSKTTWVNSSDWRQSGVIRKFADSMTMSGINYWQYKRYCVLNLYDNVLNIARLILTYDMFFRVCQIMNLHYFNNDQWKASYLKLYAVVTDLNDEYMGVRNHIMLYDTHNPRARPYAHTHNPRACPCHHTCQVVRDIAIILSKGLSLSVAYDMCWGHRQNAKQGSGCLIEMITRGVIARYHCCKNKNAADEHAHVYDDTSASMEGFAADKVFMAVAGLLTINFCCFDGDASTPQHLISHHPDAIAVRDPNHIAKNVFKQLINIFNQCKYSCDCPHIINKNKTKNKNRVHNNITKKKAKSAQVWVGKILRETKSQEEAKKLLENFLNHLEGACKEGDGCQHAFDGSYTHRGHINCKMMMDRIREYFGNNIIVIVHKIIIEGIGDIHTNTNESVNKGLLRMRDKSSVLSAALYIVRSDCAYLAQNQKAITRHRPGCRRHFLGEILQRLGHSVISRQMNTWINGAKQANINDDKNRTVEAKKKKIQRKHSTFVKTCGEAKNSQDFYKSGGKKTQEVIDLLNDDPVDDVDADDVAEEITNDMGSTIQMPATDESLKLLTPKGLALVTTNLITASGGEVEKVTSHIPKQGKGQKAAWMQLCHELIVQHKIETLTVPVEACRKTHRLVSALQVADKDILDLHPQVCEVRIKFEGGWGLLLFFDLETTGLGLYQVQILEFACIACLSRPGDEPLQYLGQYSSYVDCKMRFPEDITALTNIETWHHETSVLRNAPTLPEVNAVVRGKIIEWKRLVEKEHDRRVYSQLVSWNGDSYDIALWMLQTDEMMGEGAWASMFLNTDTDLVAQTDLYRVRPYSGFGPKSKKDIEDYFSYKPKSKRTPNDKRITFATEQQALWEYVHHHFPESLEPKDVDKIRQDNPDDNFGAYLQKVIKLGETNLQLMTAAAKAAAKKTRTRTSNSAPSTSTATATASPAPPTETVPVPQKRQREEDCTVSNVPVKRKKTNSKKRKKPRTCVHMQLRYFCMPNTREILLITDGPHRQTLATSTSGVWVETK